VVAKIIPVVTDVVVNGPQLTLPLAKKYIPAVLVERLKANSLLTFCLPKVQ